MNKFLYNPIPTAAQAIRGYEDGGEVSSIDDLIARYYEEPPPTEDFFVPGVEAPEGTG